MIRVGLTGADGRMGSVVIEELEKSSDIEFEEGFDTSEEFRSPEEFRDHLQRIDVVVDFTAPSACVEFAVICREEDVPFVTGTTNLTDQQINSLEEISNDIPVLKASNFSRGINVLRKAVREITGNLENYDVEIIESHHSGKVDAPSGTAKTLADDIENNGDFSRRVYGREGSQPREQDEIGIHAVRAGGIKGSHKIVFANEEEKIVLFHESNSRNVFASGALDAAQWIQNQENGFYSFEDVLK